MKLKSYCILTAIKASAYHDAYLYLCEHYGLVPDRESKITVISDKEVDVAKIHTWQNGTMYAWEQFIGFRDPMSAYNISMSIVWNSLNET